MMAMIMIIWSGLSDDDDGGDNDDNDDNDDDDDDDEVRECLASSCPCFLPGTPSLVAITSIISQRHHPIKGNIKFTQNKYQIKF